MPVNPLRSSALREEVQNLDLRLTLCLNAAAMIPPLVGLRVRTRLIRLGGIAIGHGTTIGGEFRVSGSGRPAARVRIGEHCWINAGCSLDACAEITIGDWVAFGQDVMILTNTHEIGPASARAGALEAHPVVVGDGVWIGAKALILPGVEIGAGSIVAAGAVVNRSVAPNSLVAGVPARLVRTLDD